MRPAAPLVALLLLLSGAEAFGAPPIYTTRERPNEGSRAAAWRAAARARGVDRPALARAVTSSQVSAVVILVQFTDHAADTLNHTPQDFHDLLFSVGTVSTGSLRDYYREVSGGRFDIDGAVTRWYTAPQTYAFYTNGQAGIGGGQQSAQGLAEDAVLLADADVDFSQFDNDGPDGIPRGQGSTDDDGFVDALFIVHAGPGNEETGSDNDIVSHQFHLLAPVLTQDGVQAFGYTTEPERWASSTPYTTAGELMSVGVFCHEFGHVLGLPDLYDLTDTPVASEGIGDWDLMGTGVYTHRAAEPLGSSPAHMSAWSKVRLGWANLTYVLQDSSGVTIPPVETSGRVFRLWEDGVDDGEYFLVENRQPIGFDQGLVRTSIEAGDGPAHGLLIYHVNEAASTNDDPDSKMVDVEEAGGMEALLGYVGTQNLDLSTGNMDTRIVCDRFVSVRGNRGDRWDPWPGATGSVSFDAGSCPGSGSVCGGAPSHVAIRNIGESGGDVTADFYVSGVRIQRLAVAVDDGPLDGTPNNGNGRVEEGETVRLRWVFQNQGAAPTGPLVGTLTADPFLTLLNDSTFYSSITPGAADSGSVVYATALSAPDPRGALLHYAMHGAPGLVDSDSVQVLLGAESGICETFEGTTRLWFGVSAGCNGVNQWHREAGINHTPSGTWAYRLGPQGLIGSYAGLQDARLISQPIALSGASDTLRFWQRYDSDLAGDGLNVEISADGGNTWAPLNPVGGYPNGDRWSGTQATFSLAEVPLTGYSGQVQIGFRFRSNPPTEGLGWWLDDIVIAGDDACGTTAVAVSRFDAAPIPDGSVRLTWHVTDAAGALIRIDRESVPGAREPLATVVPDGADGSYEDRSVQAGGIYRYWIVVSRPGEPDATAGPVEVVMASTPSPPKVLAISRVRPNPFQGSAAFTVSLDRDGPFVVRVYRADGSLVRTLANTRGRAESYPFTWDGTDDRGRTVGAGLYLFELRSTHGVRVQKAILLR